MVARTFRAALLAAFVLALFGWARPARAASAPFCDDRGATALAAPPALEAPDEAIARARVSTCDHERVEFGPAIRVPLKRASFPSDSRDPAVPSDTALPPAPDEEMLEDADVRDSPCIGVRGRVERPPRRISHARA